MITSFFRLLCFSLVVTSAATAAPWPAWRGAGGNGVCEETELPLKWSATENVKWKVALPERGNSTPIVWGDQIFITQAVGHERLVLCFSRQDGKELWRAGAKEVADEPTHSTNPYCSASPVTDGERVYAWFGSAGLYCFDVSGKQLWHRDLGEHRHEWGYSSGPMLHGDLCYLNFGPGPRSFLLAVNKLTGSDVWRQELGKVEVAMPRNDGFAAKEGVVGSWSLPLMIKTENREELVMSWPEQVRSYDPKTGQPLWQCAGLNPLVYSSTIYGEGVIIAMGGYSGSTVAVRPGGSGDVTQTHRLWHEPRDSGHIGSGVIKDGHIYIHTMNGIVECVELKTGKRLWKERLKGGGGRSESWSSVVLAGDRLYLVNQGSDCFVLRASPTFEVLAHNPLNDGLTNASLAISDGQIIVRTHAHLWCIGK
ncbi:MAG: PQQ-binding-like beta-propeller repeat protein [Verrucomicrobia bacterium]|nr:PQQ-binding-like beta-propeller repeat protein [Verrucomicrobiota bacterium]